MNTGQKRSSYSPNHKFANITLKIILLTALVLLRNNFSANLDQDTSFVPDRPVYGKVQYAGNVGLLSIGVGKFYYDDKLSMDINYGYLPKWINGVKVHTFSLKIAYHFWKYEYIRMGLGCYAGLSINYGITRNTFLIMPERFPDGYYLANAIHFCPLLGTRFLYINSLSKINGLGFYGELGTVDYMLYYTLKNKQIKLYQIWNLCFGFIIPVIKSK